MSLRWTVFSFEMYRLRTSCCVIVEPPSTTSPAVLSRPQRAGDPLCVDPAAAVEAVVLDRDGRFAEPRRHLRRARPTSRFRSAGIDAEQRVVRRVDERVRPIASGGAPRGRSSAEGVAPRRPPDAHGDEDGRGRRGRGELPPRLRRARRRRTRTAGAGARPLGAPRVVDAAMVATSRTGFRVRDATPRAACRVIVAACAAPSQRRGLALRILRSRLAIWALAAGTRLFEDELDPSRGRLDTPRLHEWGRRRLWARWDSNWYLRIAESGYSWPSSTPAFFPGYPLLVAGLGRALGDRFLLAGLVVSLVACAAAFALLYRLVAERLGTH